MIFRSILLLGLLFIVVNGRIKIFPKIDVDYLRYDFLNTEDRLWKYVTDLIRNGYTEKNSLEVNLIEEYEKFGFMLQEVEK